MTPSQLLDALYARKQAIEAAWRATDPGSDAYAACHAAYGVISARYWRARFYLTGV
jgi:hypothetical protein